MQVLSKIDATVILIICRINFVLLTPKVMLAFVPILKTRVFFSTKIKNEKFLFLL